MPKLSDTEVITMEKKARKKGQVLRYPHEFSKLVVPAGMPEPSAMDGNFVTFQVLNKSGLPFKVSHPCDWMLASLPA